MNDDKIMEFIIRSFSIYQFNPHCADFLVLETQKYICIFSHFPDWKKTMNFLCNHPESLFVPVCLHTVGCCMASCVVKVASRGRVDPDLDPDLTPIQEERTPREVVDGCPGKNEKHRRNSAPSVAIRERSKTPPYRDRSHTPPCRDRSHTPPHLQKPRPLPKALPPRERSDSPISKFLHPSHAKPPAAGSVSLKPGPVFYLWLSKVSDNERRRY